MKVDVVEWKVIFCSQSVQSFMLYRYIYIYLLRMRIDMDRGPVRIKQS